MVWELWKERNHRIFKAKERNLDRFLLKLEVSILEVMNANLQNSSHEEGSFSFWDGHMNKLWPNLINPPWCMRLTRRRLELNANGSLLLLDGIN